MSKEMSKYCYSIPSGQGGSTSLTFETPLSEEAALLIRQANPGYMRMLNLCQELANRGVKKPIEMRTDINIFHRESQLNVDKYWPESGTSIA